MSVYAKALILLLVISGIITGIWQLLDVAGDGREAEVRLELGEVIDNQNDAVQGLANAGALDASNAAGRALEVKAEAAERKTQLTKGHGPDAMNAWYSEVFP